MKQKCVLAYSGGLDTSAIIPWLKENYQFDVIAYCCNVGNLPPEQELRDRALQLGAVDFVYEDAEDEFVSDYVYPMLRSGATYFDDYLLGTAIARPLIGARVAAFAQRIGARAIAHGATGKGNDHIRFERAWAYLCPDLEVIAPWKIWSYRSREELIAYLGERGMPWGQGKKTYSVDVNTFHRSCEGGDLETIEKPYAQSDVYEWLSLNPPSEPTLVTLGVENGLITTLNGKTQSPRQVLEQLNMLGSKYGIGVCDIVEERANGIKSRGVYETPGGTLAHTAIKALRQICWTRELYQTYQPMSDRYGTLVYDGLWFSDARLALEGFFAAASNNLSGSVTLRLQASHCAVLNRESPYSLYNPNVVSFESDSLDIHKAALGYTKILTLSSLLQGQRQRETHKHK
jgi:argininosuccinate synthase